MAKSHNPTQSPKQRTHSRYKRSETTRLLKGAMDAGLAVRGIEVDPITGTLRVLVGESEKNEPSNDLDSWLRKKDARQA